MHLDIHCYNTILHLNIDILFSPDVEIINLCRHMAVWNPLLVSHITSSVLASQENDGRSSA